MANARQNPSCERIAPAIGPAAVPAPARRLPDHHPHCSRHGVGGSALALASPFSRWTTALRGFGGIHAQLGEFDDAALGFHEDALRVRRRAALGPESLEFPATAFSAGKSRPRDVCSPQARGHARAQTTARRPLLPAARTSRSNPLSRATTAKAV